MRIGTAGAVLTGVIFLSVAAFLSATVPVSAETKHGIEQVPHSYGYGSAQGLMSPTFVIRESHTYQPLKKVLKPPITVATTGSSSPGTSKDMRNTVVYFEKDSSQISPEAKSILESLNIDIPVSVTGYTCPLGTEEYNRRLAERRACAVANYLRERGVTVTNVQGKGGCCFVEGDFGMSRRVEIQPEV